MNEENVKKVSAKKIKKPVGPFITEDTFFEKGKERIIEVTVYPKYTAYRLRGKSEVYYLPHATAFQKAIGIQTGFSLEPRNGIRIKRGSLS